MRYLHFLGSSTKRITLYYPFKWSRKYTTFTKSEFSLFYCSLQYVLSYIHWFSDKECTQGSRVNVVSRLWTGWLQNCGLIPGRENRFLPIPRASKSTPGPIHTSIQWVPRVTPKRLKQLGHEVLVPRLGTSGAQPYSPNAFIVGTGTALPLRCRERHI